MIILGNILALIGSILMLYIAILKSKKKILYFQSIQMLVLAFSNLVLSGYTGAIANIVGIVRNILCYKNKLNIYFKLIISILLLILSLFFDSFTLIRTLPIISGILYTWLMGIKNIIKFKLLIVVTIVLWLIYDIYIKSFVSALFDALTISTNIITMYQLLNRKEEIINE